MIKYVPQMTSVVLEEIPDRVSLAVEISNCRGSCIGCHSPFLKQDIGVELTPDAVDRLIADNFGVNCFLLLGEGKDPEALLRIAEHLRVHHPELERAVYSGGSLRGRTGPAQRAHHQPAAVPPRRGYHLPLLAQRAGSEPVAVILPSLSPSRV